MLACVDKNIGVALRLLISQWNMHHCDVLCLVLSSLCSLQTYNYAEHLYNILLFLRTTSPPTHFTQAPPSHAKNRYLNSRLMILHASPGETVRAISHAICYRAVECALSSNRVKKTLSRNRVLNVASRRQTK